MILTKDSTKLGLILGLIAPIFGLLIFKWYKFGIFSMKEFFQFISLEPGFRTLSAGLSLSLLANAIVFTLYINTNKDNTAKGIFIVRLDAHSIPKPNYIELCIKVLKKGVASCVGGVWDIVPGDKSWIARSIAAAASHPLGVGDAQYRFTKNSDLST